MFFIAVAIYVCGFQWNVAMNMFAVDFCFVWANSFANMAGSMIMG